MLMFVFVACCAKDVPGGFGEGIGWAEGGEGEDA